MKAYLDLLKHVMSEGVDRGDRTGTGTRSVFGYQMRFDLQKGFPAVTTKKFPFKPMVSELLFFLGGIPDRRILHHNGFKEDKFDIWKGNALDRKDGTRFNGYNLGNLYPIMWRNLPIHNITEYCYVTRRKGVDTPDDQEHPLIDYREYHRSGEIIHTDKFGPYTILGKLNTDKRDTLVVRFNNTGYLATTERARKDLQDRLLPSVEGVGYLGYGEFDTKTTTYKKLHRVWQDMLIRCYNPRENHNSYKDLKISKEWHNFSNFYKDAFCLPNFQEYVDSKYKYNLDKDYYGSSIYCKEACIFIPSDINKSLNAGGTGEFRVYEYEGDTYFSKTSLEENLFGKRKKHSDAHLKDLGVKILEDKSKDLLVRPKIFIDQIKTLVDGIISNPEGRRHVVNAWNIESDRNAVLSACHNTFQLYVENGKLSCQLYQRSGDIFLGIPFNIASYATLTHMIAQVCGLEVGEFVHTLGDAHIYHNHFDQVKEILSREPFDLPELRMNTKVKGIFDFQLEDFQLENYRCHNAIKAPMAV